MEEFRFTSALWRWPAQEAWCFITVPAELAEEIRLSSGPPRGFGSVRVEATINATTWRTSLFPDSGKGTFLLPIKKEVRRAEDLDVDDLADVTLRVLTA